MEYKVWKRDIITVSFIVIFFILWYLYWENSYIYNLNKWNDNTKNETILQEFNKYFKNDKNLDLKLFYEAYSIINKNYYSSNSLSSKDIVYWMIKGLVESLNDKHSEFFNIDETKKFNEVLSWDFEWIWAVIQKSDFWVYIDRLIAWSPAKEAWLMSWDIIIKANDIDLKNMTVNEAVAKIRWKAWTMVKLEIIRPWEKENLIKEVTRRQINIPSVDYKMLDDKTWYIILSIFWEKSWEEFKKALDELYSKNMKWLIIDLRDDGGWLLETAVSILSNFIEEKKLLVTTKEKNPKNNMAYFSRGNTYKDIPLIVLINWNSASASEITAWALKEYNLAILVWEKSYWKWSVQQPFNLSDWSEMKITVAKWFTPLDNLIDWVWIKPDFEVQFKKEDFDNKYDRQLEESKKILNKSIELNGDIKATKEFFNKQKQEELQKKREQLSSSWSSK